MITVEFSLKLQTTTTFFSAQITQPFFQFLWLIMVIFTKYLWKWFFAKIEQPYLKAFKLFKRIPGKPVRSNESYLMGNLANYICW